LLRDWSESTGERGLSRAESVIAPSYKGGDVASYLFLISKQNGRNCIQKIAKQDGSHADYVTGSAFEAHLITSLYS